MNATAGTRPVRLRDRAAQVQAGLADQRARWDRGFTRRKFLAGTGVAVAAGLGSQLVTTRHAYAAPGATNVKTMVVVFLRGGMDGLSVVVPATDPDYVAARPDIGIPSGALLQLDARFGLHPRCSPMYPFWQSGQLGIVHAVASPDATRSHFQAQACVERGTASPSTRTGWLDRALQESGPGTTFRAVAEGPAPPYSVAGADGLITMRGLDSLAVNDESPEATAALTSLYTGLNDPAEPHVLATLGALAEAEAIAARSGPPAASLNYPDSDLGEALADVARVIQADAGLRLATVDVGGWDVHSAAGSVTGPMGDHLSHLAQALGAFGTDLGTRLGEVTLVTMSEFGRRVAQNGSGGTDHGHGNAMFVLGGGVRGGVVHGAWPGLAADALDVGDLAGANDYRDVLGEVAQRSLGLGSLSTVFPGHAYRPLGIMGG